MPLLTNSASFFFASLVTFLVHGIPQNPMALFIAMLQVHKLRDRLYKGQASLLFPSSDRCVLGQGDGSQRVCNTTLGSRKDELISRYVTLAC